MFARLVLLVSEAAPASVAPEIEAALKKYRRGAVSGQAPSDPMARNRPGSESPGGD
jgi:hypothetical protein